MTEKDLSPVLIITPDASKLVREYASNGSHVITGGAETISQQLTAIRSATTEKSVVVGDINPLVAGLDIESKLLKVLEALLCKVVFISSVDVFSEIFLSRFIRVIKYPVLKKPKSNSLTAFKEYVQKDELDMTSVLEECVSFLPFYMNYRKSHIPGKLKLLEFIR